MNACSVTTQVYVIDLSSVEKTLPDTVGKTQMNFVFGLCGVTHDAISYIRDASDE